MVHDYEIVYYDVNVISEEINVVARMKSDEIKITFKGVLTHYFQDVIHQNVISDIYESSIQKFIDSNRSLLMERKCYGWPIDYKDESDLKAYLEDNQYKVFYIDSALGLYGFVIAREMIFFEQNQ